MKLRTAICCAMIASIPAAVFAQSVPQPDQILYDTGVSDVQKGRFERARLTLQTLLNTYATSTFAAPAKLEIAESWYREGGTRGLTQAEKECKELIAQFPETSSSADAQKMLRKIQDARAPK